MTKFSELDYCMAVFHLLWVVVVPNTRNKIGTTVQMLLITALTLLLSLGQNVPLGLSLNTGVLCVILTQVQQDTISPNNRHFV